MGVFRTAADLLSEVLQKAGEPQNGSSRFQTIAMTYLNKVHQAVVAGGNLFDIQVDEAWTWARARQPFSIDLQPAYVSGTVTMTQGLTSGIFSVAPTASLEGWFFQVQTTSTVYRITQHSANSTTFTIDSGFVDLGSAGYNFRAFQLEYDLIPSYLYVDNFSDRIDFSETAGVQLTAVIPHGSYTPTNFITQVAASMTSAGTNTYSGSYDSVLRYFTVTSSMGGVTIFTLLGASGTNFIRHALPLMGMDRLDQSGASSYVSTYIVNGISRLVEPFKVNRNWDRYQPFITSSDPYNMEMDFPLALTAQRIPDRFCKVFEDNSGRYAVRFNAYPDTVTKCVVDWVPLPLDLQNNSASVPLIPRKDADVLIHGAAAFVAFDKNFDKFQTLLDATKGQLEAMQKRNRSELQRTGPNFGQIIPRLDQYHDFRRFEYGYTAEPSVLGGQGTNTPNTMETVVMNFGQFQTASVTSTQNVLTLAGGTQAVFNIIAVLTQPFAGTGITALNAQIGITGTNGYFVTNFNLLGAANSQVSSITTYFPTSSASVTVTLTATGANLSALNQGQLTFYLNLAVH